jgi:sugar phosphate isomerase/epimerase
MSAPIALQLYSLRELLNVDFTAGIRKVAEIGYAGVETAGFLGTTPQDAARLFGELGLTVCSAHSPLPLGDKQAEVLDTMAALGCSRLVCPWKPQELFASIDGIRQVCDELNEANIVARAHGLTLSYHNHWAECALVGGHRAYELMFAHLSPEILFEVDTYWAKTAGVDPVTLVRQLGTRAPLLHIKDGPCVMDAPMTAVGDGIQDVPGIVAAGAGATEWLIVELDRCATEMLEAVTKSYRYMIGKGLAHGRRN